MKKIFFDMDGTLNEWRPHATIEETHQIGFFSSAKPHHAVCALVGTLVDMGCEVYVTSNTYEDTHSEQEKRNWIRRYLPEIPENRQIFIPYGRKKEEYILHSSADVLVSDRTENELDSWSGRGVKVMNGHNGKRGRWTGARFNTDADLSTMLEAVLGVMTA